MGTNISEETAAYIFKVPWLPWRQVTGSSETTVPNYQAKWCHITLDHNCDEVTKDSMCLYIRWEDIMTQYLK